MDGAITIEISEFKILIYLLGLLRIHEKRKTAEISWRNGYGFIRKNLSASLITLLASLTRWDIPFRHKLSSPNKRFQIL